MTEHVPAQPVLAALRRGDLAGARELRFAPGLTTFPREVFDLADTLEILDLSGGALTALPDDLGRLRSLRALFCSGNPFERLPPVLGDCASLSQVGFRGCGLREVPAESLPPLLRWLTLTDNRIEVLPEALGRRPHLQKLMLSGNRLEILPRSLCGAGSLELIRLSANRFEAVPAWLTDLPRLAWATWAGNPVERGRAPAAGAAIAGAAITGVAIPWADLDLGAILGEGASGRVHQARWRGPGGAEAVAVKLFKGSMTSDGLPESEMAACLAAGGHPNLAGGLGRVEGHPEEAQGLVMPLLPAHWRVLAGPPSLASCSRDVYAPDLVLDPLVAWRLARAAAAAAAHLHAGGLLHGDLYAHNVLWDGTGGKAVLGDLGAACALPVGEAGARWQRVETRAWGLLLSELLDRCTDAPAGLRALERACVGPEVRARPLMAEVLERLDALRPGAA